MDEISLSNLHKNYSYTTLTITGPEMTEKARAGSASSVFDGPMQRALKTASRGVIAGGGVWPWEV